MRTSRAEDAYYNLLVRGFRAGQLDLKTEVPAGLAHLADPYDPVANANYLLVDGHPLWDLSYYHGKLYLYYGVTPALVLFWPYAALTGHYLGHKDAVGGLLRNRLPGQRRLAVFGVAALLPGNRPGGGGGRHAGAGSGGVHADHSATG